MLVYIFQSFVLRKYSYSPFSLTNMIMDSSKHLKEITQLIQWKNQLTITSSILGISFDMD